MNGLLRHSPSVHKGLGGVTPAVPTGLTLTVVSDTDISVAYTSNYPIEIWYSTDNVTYTKHGNSTATPYAMTGLTAGTLYWVKVRAKNGSKFSDFINPINDVTHVNLLLTSVGTGVGISTLVMKSTKNTLITVDGNATFYTNPTATLGASKEWTVIPGEDQTIYLKCTSGTANFIINNNAITKISWVSKSNAAKLSGDITNLINIAYLDISWSNAITGDITNFNNLTYLSALSTSSLSGDISGLTKLQYIIALGGTLSGNITELLDLEYISMFQTNSFTGNITNLIKLTYFKNIGTNNNITGDISNLIDLTYLYTNDACGSLIGSITLLTKLTYIFVGNTTILSGSISDLTSLTYVQINGDNSLTGDLTNLVDLTFLLVLGNNVSITGDVTGLTKLTTLRIEGTNSITGDVSGLTELTVLVNNNGINTNTLYGDVTGLTKMVYLELSGNNSVTGDIQYMTNLQVCYTFGTSILSVPNVTNIKGLLYLKLHDTVTLTSDNVNQILADFWANRDEPKLRTERIINIAGSLSSGSPTGQGIIDKAALQAYRSPNNDPTKALWTVTTR